jgi:hypothetical protein
MPGEEFTIEFNYKGWDYTGRVTIKDAVFIVNYALNSSPLFEKLIEISAVVCAGVNPLEWEEVNYNPRLKKSNKALLKVIGEALEDRKI